MIRIYNNRLWLFNPPSLLLFKNLNTRETGPVATRQISSLLLSGTPLGLQQFPKIWLWNGAKLNKNRIARLLFWSLVGSTFTFSTEPLSTMTPHDNDFALCTGQLLGAWVRVQASSASTGNSARSLLPRWETLVTQRAWARASPAWRSKAYERKRCGGKGEDMCVHATELNTHTGISGILCWEVVQHHLDYLVLYDWVMLLLTTLWTQSLTKLQSTPGLAWQEYYPGPSLQHLLFCWEEGCILQVCSSAVSTFLFFSCPFGALSFCICQLNCRENTCRFFPKPKCCIPTHFAWPIVQRTPKNETFPNPSSAWVLAMLWERRSHDWGCKKTAKPERLQKNLARICNTSRNEYAWMWKAALHFRKNNVYIKKKIFTDWRKGICEACFSAFQYKMPSYLVTVVWFKKPHNILMS